LIPQVDVFVFFWGTPHQQPFAEQQNGEADQQPSHLHYVINHSLLEYQHA